MVIKLIDDWGRWRKRDEDYFKLLSSTKNFQELIKKARKKIGLDARKLPKNFETSELYLATEEYAQNLVDLYDMNVFWREPLRFYIATGKMPSPGVGIVMSGWNPILNQDKKKDKPSTFSITISEQTGNFNIKNFVDQNRDYIQNFLGNLPRKRSRLQKAHIKLDAFKLYERGVTVQDIAQYIVNKYDKSLDEQIIWNWIRRMEQALYGRKIK